MAGDGKKRQGGTAAGSSCDKKPRAAVEEKPKRGAAEEDADAPDMGEFEDDDDEESSDEGSEVVDGDQEEGEEEDDNEPTPQQGRIFRPGLDQIEDGEQLEPEPGTYDMLHRAQVEWPCLSFDILKDDLGAQRSDFPMTAYVVAGTQAKDAADNRLYMMKWSKLHKTLKDDQQDSDDEDEDSEAEEGDRDAQLGYKGAVHPGGVNRVRSMPQAPHIVASWSDMGKVHMWNLQAQRRALDKPSERVPGNVRPLFTCDSHKEEGFALDFSTHETGRFLSGSNDGAVHLWEPSAGGWSVVSDKPFAAHTGSVEDVQWQRAGTTHSVFATCSSDQSICVWDARSSRDRPSSHIKDAHGADVNVISWSPCVGELLMSGSDDGGFKIWDTRNTGAGAMANFLWHRKPITSVDWHPTDETVLAVASEDNSISLWDMAVEDDRPDGKEDAPGEGHFPAQLLFLHMGQKDIKEIHWHPQIPSVCISTAGSGFNVFKTCNV